MTDLEKIRERWEKGGVIFITSFFSLFITRISAILAPGVLAWLAYTEWNGKFNGLMIFLLIMVFITIIWSLFFIIRTGSVMLKGNTLIIKKNYRRAEKIPLERITYVTDQFVKRTLSSSGSRFTRINFIKSNGKSSSILIIEGKSVISEPRPSAAVILHTIGWIPNVENS